MINSAKIYMLFNKMVEKKEKREHRSEKKKKRYTPENEQKAIII